MYVCCMHVCVCVSVFACLCASFFCCLFCCKCVTADTERVQNSDIVAHQPILFFDGYIHVSVPPVHIGTEG